MKHRICVLPGEGIGPEVTQEAVRVLEALPVSFEFVYGDIGFQTYTQTGNSLPTDTLKNIKTSDATLFGAVTTPPNIPDYSSPIVRLRQQLDLYANIRPCTSFPIPSSREKVNLVVVRENTEGLYSQSERVEDKGNKAITEMIVTRKATERIVRHAFAMAQKMNFNTVTIVHKANVLRETGGLFLKVATEVAQEFPEINMNDMLVDACAMQIIKNPSQFQVIVTTNMFGDILSDEAAMLVGGLGIAHSANIGGKNALFEPVHGSSPKYEGKNVANPFATILAAKLMLEHLGETGQAKNIQNAVVQTMKQGVVTKDLSGNKTTTEVTDHVIAQLK